jgi:hypothetical protein
LGLPTVLSPRNRSNIDFLPGSLYLIRTICPAHLSLADLIHFTISGSAYSWYNSSLYPLICVSAWNKNLS